MPRQRDVISYSGSRNLNELMTEKHIHNIIISMYAYVHNTMHYVDIAHMMDVSYIVLQQCGTVYVVFAQAHPNYPACMQKG